MDEAVADCSVCPRLCRDVCPVAVHGQREDFIPSEKMRGVAAAFGHSAGVADPERLLACTDCGACSAYCLLSIPVAPWLAQARKHLDVVVQSAPGDPPAPAVASSDLPENTVILPVCCASEDPAQRRVRAAPAQTEGAPDAGLRVTPGRPPGHDAKPPSGHHWPALGSTCCGATLDPRVGDLGLRDRMANAMLAEIQDGSTVLVATARCAAHLHQAAAGRVSVVTTAADATAPNGSTSP